MSLTHPSPAVADAVRAVLADILGLPADDAALSPDANLFELGLDSLGVVRFIVDIEGRLGLQLDQDDLRADLFERLDRLIERVEARLAEGA